MGDFDHFEACSFDCYGTLIDWETGILDALRPWATPERRELDDERILAVFARHETAVQRADPHAPYPEVLGQTLKAMAHELGLESTDADRQAFAASIQRWPPFPDSAAALARLGQRFRLIILSNVDRQSFEWSRARLGIDFDLVITAEDTGTYKPDPASFQALIEAATTIGIDSAAIVHVAQSRFHDIEPATDAGLAAVWIDRRHDRPGHGATPPPRRQGGTPSWRFTGLADFAATAVA